MPLTVAYIVACFWAGWWREPRRLRVLMVGSCALLCALYLVPSDVVRAVGSPSLSWWTLAAPETTSRPPVASAPAPEVSSSPAAHSSKVGLERWKDPEAFARLQRLAESATARRVGFALYLLGAAAILVWVRAGLYLTLLGALAGDAVMLPWYPFVKGFSSPESLFFLNRGFIVNPLEVYLVLMAISWAVRRMGRGPWIVKGGELFWPSVVFAAFLAGGLAYGIGTGGDVRIALWEVRAGAYLVAVIVLTSNLVETSQHVQRLIWTAMVAVLLKGVVATLYFIWVLGGDVGSVRSIAEHTTAIHLNSLFVLSLAVWIFRASWAKRILLPLMVPGVVLGYIAMQRRAAFIALTVAATLLVTLLYRVRPQLFWRVAPAVALLLVVYVAVGWSSQRLIAGPVQAVRSVVAGGQASDDHLRSNRYRALEEQNIAATIHRHPITGVGFGQKFYMVVPMPNIGHFFEWWEYITHNSILWMWMKTGIGGFMVLLLLVGRTLALGSWRLHGLRDADLQAVTLTATLYVVMHFVYAGVDMSWDAKSTVYLGVMMGVINALEWIAPAARAGAGAAPAGVDVAWARST